MHRPRLHPPVRGSSRLGAGLLLLLMLGGCGKSTPPELPGAASEPAGAVRQLVAHLRDNDLAAFARDALPPEVHARLAEAWREDRSRWPLSELPLDSQVEPILAALARPGSERTLRREFDRQFAGQDVALRDAARSLALFGGQYLKQQRDYSPEERAHYAQIVAALGTWAAQAPLGDRKRAYAAIDRLAAVARATGLDGEEGLRQAGMEESLRRLGPFLAALKAVVADYGLDLDGSLADLRTGLVEEKGDRATVRIHYPLGTTEIDTVVTLARRGGRWYLSDYLEHADTLLAAAAADRDNDADALPALPEPPPGEPQASGPAPAR
ncbi:hypothetical protein [Pseudoxanthomonas broegbernensis]|uniref:hypothetical protein n=1 Tax=Pseudoxanthomonas broegbernensis TaxID=83619 RepID=UPI0016162A7A|nr:hypothetical protein [Pseudoxanthomonas broegbernensis]MBB6066445.1 hypothetical protein [Pseudoxanthomonas broegbernensis]